MTRDPAALTCREVTDFLGDYIAGELVAEVRAAFEAHTAACPECLAYLRSYRETIALARDAYRDEEQAANVPEELARAILVARRTGSGPSGKR